MTSGKGSSGNEGKHSRKKGKVIQPLHGPSLSKFAKQDKTQKSNADILAELAKKTAELAEQVKGPEKPSGRVLMLEEPADSENLLTETGDQDNTQLVDPAKEPNKPNTNAAADLIRAKLKKIFKDEPDAATEAAESVVVGPERSPHQEYMYKLTTSGKSLAEIQTKWHEYYIALNDEEKHAVWQEFYKNQHAMSAYSRHVDSDKPKDEDLKSAPKAQSSTKKLGFSGDAPRSVADIKAQLFDKVSAGGTLKPVHHLKSALFGIGLAAFVGLVISFVFFNEVFVAPFISPSKTVSATPIIGNNQADIGPEPKIIIPKINLEVPVVYGLNTVEEKSIQQALEDGVVHYAASPEPGEIGNSVIVGHSSNNILNSGKYKFAFVLLKRMEVGDTFFIHKGSVRYTYKIYEKKIVPPNDVSVLGTTERENTMTLITCDPPGTSINRLIIVAEQISPDASQNSAPSIDVDSSPREELPSNAPSLWSRINPF